MSALNGWNRVWIGLIALQIAWLIGERALHEDAYRPVRSVTSATLFPNASPERVARIELKKGGGTTALTKRENGEWSVASEGGEPADAYFIQVALDSLATMKPGNIVSDNPERHLAYEMTPPFGVEVLAKDVAGVELARFVAGRATPDGRGFYIRYPFDGTDILLITPNVRDAFYRYGNSPGAWREKTIYKVDPREIVSIEVIHRDEELELRRVIPASGDASDHDDWELTKPVVGPVERIVGNAMAEGIADLSADRYYSGSSSLSELGLEPPRIRIIAHRKSGATLSLEIGNESGTRLYVRRSGETEIAEVPLFKLHNYLKTSAEMRRE